MTEIAERNKALVRRLYADVDAGSPTVVEDYYAQDYVDHSTSAVRAQAARPAELRESFAALRRAFPDTVHVVEDLVAENDRVVARVSARATHTGHLFGQPPTGRVVTLSSIVIYRMANGRIAERWAEHGTGILEQLGIDAPHG